MNIDSFLCEQKKQTEKEIQAIVKAFRSFIRQQDYFDLVYSEKIGFVRLLVHAPEEGAVVLNTPEQMLEYLCSDLINDVVYGPDNPKQSDSDAVLTEYEKTESRRRLSAIFKRMGMDRKNCADLAEKYLEQYQGDSEHEAL